VSARKECRGRCVTRPILFLLVLAALTGCCNGVPSVTVLLGGTYNINNKCIGHAAHLCGPENTSLPSELAGVFATESDCQGIRLRGLTNQEQKTPVNQLPLLLEVFYIGTQTESYTGDGKNESDGWMFNFNGPRGYFSAKSRTESDMVRRVCKAAKGQGAEITNP